MFPIFEWGTLQLQALQPTITKYRSQHLVQTVVLKDDPLHVWTNVVFIETGTGDYLKFDLKIYMS